MIDKTKAAGAEVLDRIADAAQAVVDAWEGGDLAGAVNWLEGEIDGARAHADKLRGDGAPPGDVKALCEAFGFELEHTGGGCELLSLSYPSGARVWASCVDGGFPPDNDDWLVVAYSPAEDCEGVLCAGSDGFPADGWAVAVAAAVAFAQLY